MPWEPAPNLGRIGAVITWADRRTGDLMADGPDEQLAPRPATLPCSGYGTLAGSMLAQVDHMAASVATSAMRAFNSSRVSTFRFSGGSGGDDVDRGAIEHHHTRCYL